MTGNIEFIDKKYDGANNTEDINCPIYDVRDGADLKSRRDFYQAERRRIILANKTRSKHFQHIVISGICVCLVILIFSIMAAAISIKRAVKLREGFKTIEWDIQTHNYIDAAALRDELATAYEKESVHSRLREYDEEMLSSGLQYVKTLADSGEYDLAIAVIDDLSSVLGDDKLKDVYSDVITIQIRDALMRYNLNNDTEGAINYLTATINRDGIDRETVVARLSPYLSIYKESIEEEANQYANNGDCASAISLLKTYEDITSDSEIAKTIEEYSVAIVRKNMPDGSLADIVGYLGKSIERYGISDPNLISTYKSYVADYKADVFAQAEHAMENYDYSMAVTVLNDAHNMLPGDNEILDEIEHYKGLRPVELLELSPYMGNDIERISFTDNFGVTHYDAVQRYLGGEGIDSSYKIDGKYCRLVLNLSVDQCNKDMINDTGLYIYCDGNLTYSYVSNSEDRQSLDINLDITGVDDLRITIGRVNYYGRSMIPSGIMLYPIENT